MDNENKEALSPITKEIEEKAVKIKEGLKHVETKENNKLPTAAGKILFIYYQNVIFLKKKKKFKKVYSNIYYFIEIEAEKKEKESEGKK